jgi:hypothetical protein
MENKHGSFPPEIDRPRAILPVLRGELESLALQALDQRGGQEWRDDRQTAAGLKRVDTLADEDERLLATEQVRTDVEGFEVERRHGGGQLLHGRSEGGGGVVESAL